MVAEAGIGPSPGVVHADNPYRDSFVYDVMEAIKPDVDMWLIDFVQNHKFSVKEFYEKRNGGIRLSLKITPILAETVSLWSEKIETIIGQVEGILHNEKIPNYKKRQKII